MNIESVKFDEKGLIPAVVQDANTKEVLTLAYMNRESLLKSSETGETWFFSRSRNELWHKGATSGNTQKIIEMKVDCDQDAIVVLVEPTGPACHTGTVSCFEDRVYGEESGSLSDYEILYTLEKVIEEREKTRPEGAYTTYLFEKGVDKILKKVGEESAEVIIAAKNRDKDELKWEAADLIYHLMVLLREQELPFNEVLKVLNKRNDKKSEPASE
ncbi:bifunctional phosphoribosyl-AMP cyclohydrolase/phosphoribosyl-ATP diphosphatase HisIE [Bacillus sp. CMF12]|uniref:bifunctional phosphoribosyl-AMP cyclohydrolase/phosphoribosyl-ATP diphosphatase HisIE n=1 Tax=Bacillaceae TaxID=186817 RepID=UPI001FB4571B|nr:MULTISPECIES: bifunctional phosphoribosyl-AMP cyclohydrolase/phosphoribosyl-ATP diphosphatase HisIE [Bacillaceae]MDF2037566.1 bifunctional phosphoribosyl-AMP cyclohydrolase/phosphoribosyl-ATP diphosphatase HisIE [Cytobacillus oceanisediminis]UOE55039.1 bifunctional phosphoribosyl-AMP cyclohydrolase/phosphoribosyl-ATP diphosphatase HisIE [Cytobacillus oceanisediminis]USK49496.1 bifunctional phosphoribosyl-AMP cyclohydrolase/phosphoribosyl-ATP diphosphatase HisIE [Bacillus sp. CMF12]